ncbi:hypothetical protein AgCh_008006 [Apium graveolens]
MFQVVSTRYTDSSTVQIVIGDKSVDDESEGEFLKLKATIEWLLCDNTAPVNKKVMYEIVGIDDLKKEVEKRGKDEVVTSRTSQSSPRETARKGGIFTKQDIDSLFMEVSQWQKSTRLRGDITNRQQDNRNMMGEAINSLNVKDLKNLETKLEK